MHDFHYQPARDIGLNAAHAATSPWREQGLASALAQRCFGVACVLYLRLFHRMAVHGSEHFPKPPFLLIANHASHLDALVLWAALPAGLRTRARPLAAGDVFFPKPVRAVASAAMLGAFPVWRGRGARHTWEVYRQRLTEEKLVYILFPEGKRSRTGAMDAFKSGWATLLADVAKEAQNPSEAVPVVPCWIDGAFAALRPETKLPRPEKIRLFVGKPLMFPQVPDSREGWEEVAEQCKMAVAGLEPGK